MASTETETETGTGTGTGTTSSSDSYTMPPSLQALMNAADADDDHTPRAAGHTRRRRTSEFAIYRDASTTPAQPATTSPGTQLHRERRMRERELRALEEEYLAGSSKGKGKGRASVTDDDGTEGASTLPVSTRGQPANKPPRAAATNPSASSILSHSHPDPALAPMPAPPLSRLHRRFAAPSPAAHRTAPPRRPPSKLSPTPAPADPDVSLLQHMRRLRAHYESLHPPAAPPSPKPTRPKPPPHHPSPPPPTASHNPAATTADLLAQYTFTLAHLPALTHHSRTATLTLTPPSPSPPSPGHLTLNLRPATTPARGGSQNTYTIRPHGLPITIATATTATAAAATTTTYPLADLPLQHLPAIRYATRFVAAAQRATVVGRLEVRDRACAIWAATRWADGRFEAVRAPGGEEEVRVRIEKGRVRVWAGGRRVRDVAAPRWAPAVDRARSLRSACWRALGEEDTSAGGGVPVPEDTAVPVVETGGTQAHAHTQAQAHKNTQAQPHSKHIPFPIDAGTTFVPAVGWCRRDAHTGWWGMLFLDGVRLDVDPRSGDAVWTDGGGGGGGGAAQRRVLAGGMGLREVRERVGRFVERGL